VRFCPHFEKLTSAFLTCAEFADAILNKAVRRERSDSSLLLRDFSGSETAILAAHELSAPVERCVDPITNIRMRTSLVWPIGSFAGEPGPDH